MPATRAEVTTERPERYAKQLASHLGRRNNVEYEGETAHLAFDDGTCRLTPDGGVLVMEATADNAEGLERVQDVVGRHLERFGEKDGLSVTWSAVAEQ